VASDEWGLTVPLDPKYREPVQEAAAQELDKMAGYVRKLVLKDLQQRGLLDERFEPVVTQEIPVQ
jgi:hypothetical protein